MVFLGDLGVLYILLLFLFKLLYCVDILVIEFIYGDKNYDGWKKCVKGLKNIIEWVVKDNGVVFIFVFSIGWM